MHLSDLWFILIGVLWAGYFALDGFDLGVGILLPFHGGGEADRREAGRRVMLGTIGPVWDANEVWLIVAGGAMFAAYPGWYAAMFSAFYLPLLVVLVALIVRGVAFEYRGKRDSARWRAGWDACTFAGSLVPAIAGASCSAMCCAASRSTPRTTIRAMSSPSSTRTRCSAAWPRWCCSPPTAPCS
jgi:cytochrome d ubiquinol oxidase subunit II